MFEPSNIPELNEIDMPGLAVEEVMLDGQVSHSPLESGVRNLNMVKVFSAFVLIGLLVVTSRLVTLQIGKGEAYSLASEGNRSRMIYKFAPRGVITDRYGEVIVRNTPSFELAAVPADLPEDLAVKQELFQKISSIVGISTTEIEENLAAGQENTIEPVSIKQSLSQDQALQLESVVQSTTGLQIQSRPIREYLNGPAFSNIIGYVGKLNREEWLGKRSDGYYFNDFIGKTGIESVYESSLRGQHGGIQVEVDASGKIVDRIREIEPETGADLMLTLDAGLQMVIYNALEQTLARLPQAMGAAAVAINPKTGEVLSLITSPSFDNNVFAKGIKNEEYSALVNNPRKPLLNRPIAGVYPPGSTVKPVVAAGALQEKVIDRNTKINDEGVVRLGSYTYYGWKRSGLGIMDVVSAIAWSSDPFFYVVGGGNEDYGQEGLGITKLAEYFKKFGLGSKSGINLPGEEPGFVPTPEWKKQRFAGTDEQNWYQGNTYHVSIGQGFLLATPLQVALYTAGVANDGVVMKPTLTAQEEPKVLSDSGVDQKNIEIVQQGMREVVLSGTSKALQQVSISVAGKTGTSQFNANDLSHTHAWYTAYAPYEDPQIAITVLVEGGGEGSVVSVPVVREALQWWVDNRYRP